VGELFEQERKRELSARRLEREQLLDNAKDAEQLRREQAAKDKRRRDLLDTLGRR
jgi:hypothetical protein